MKKFFILMLLMLLNVVYACETLDCNINSMLDDAVSLENLASTIAYIVGAAFIFKAIMKFKEHNESKGQVKLIVPILYFISAGLLLGLGTAIEKGRQTLSLNSSADNHSSVSGTKY